MDQRGGYADRSFSIDLQDANEAPQFFKNMGTNEEEQTTTLTCIMEEDTYYQFSMADYTRDPESSVRPVTISYNMINLLITMEHFQLLGNEWVDQICT